MVLIGAPERLDRWESIALVGGRAENGGESVEEPHLGWDYLRIFTGRENVTIRQLFPNECRSTR